MTGSVVAPGGAAAVFGLPAAGRERGVGRAVGLVRPVFGLSGDLGLVAEELEQVVGGGDQPPLGPDLWVSSTVEAGDAAGVFGVREDRFDEFGAAAVEAFAGTGGEDLVDAVGLGTPAGRLLAVGVVWVAGRDH